MKESKEISEKDIFARNAPGSFPYLKEKLVGIAGCGGLGSNIAVQLTRAGVGRLIVVDFDYITPENLNRQHFFIDQIGKLKVDALEEILFKINPFIDYKPIRTTLTPKSIPVIFEEVDVLVEAFDDAGQKSMLIETWTEINNGKLLVAASGLAGYGKTEDIKVNRTGNIAVVGDLSSPLSDGLMAPRVLTVASIQANLVIEYLMGAKSDQD